MKIGNKFLALVLVVLFATSCSKEETPEALYSVSGAISFNDIEYWRSTQTISFGAFETGSKNPTYKTVLSNSGSNSVSLNLNDLPEGSYEFKVFVEENNNHTIDLYSYGVINVNSNTSLSSAQISLVTYNRIQNQIFESCIMCHGGADGEPAGNLNLLPDSSYIELINVQAEMSNMLRVKPNLPDSSFLISVINEDNLSFEHSSSIMVSNGEMDLLLDWINTGALND